MSRSVADATSFLEAVSFNPAITAEQRHANVDVLEGIEFDMLKQLAAKDVRGLKKARFLLWNGALLGFLIGLKAIRAVGDGTMQAEGKLKDN